MGNNNKMSNISGAGVGGTLIITVFVALSLLIFATLSYSVAYSDLKLSKKSMEMTGSFYIVHGKAEEKLAEINEVLSGKVKAENILNELRNIKNIAVDYKQATDNIGIFYEVLGENNQKINVSLNVFYDDERKAFLYEILSWNLSGIELPNYEDEIINLWDGE